MTTAVRRYPEGSQSQLAVRWRVLNVVTSLDNVLIQLETLQHLEAMMRARHSTHTAIVTQFLFVVEPFLEHQLRIFGYHVPFLILLLVLQRLVVKLTQGSAHADKVAHEHPH